MKIFNGSVLFLDRKDINTDEIIPARYLTEVSKEALKPYLLEDLVLPGFDRRRDLPGKSAIVSRSNFGCGSSREHAPWALEINGINMVAAPSFARIFRQNMFNCGMLALELDETAVDELFQTFSSRQTEVAVHPDRSLAVFRAGDLVKELPFFLPDFSLQLIKAGGWVEYADRHY